MKWKAKKRTNGENEKLEQQQNNDKHESDQRQRASKREGVFKANQENKGKNVE